MRLQRVDFEGRKYSIDTEDTILIFDAEKKLVDYQTADLRTQNRIDRSLDSFEDGDLKLVEIDGTLYEEMWDGVCTFCRKAYVPEEV